MRIVRRDLLFPHIARLEPRALPLAKRRSLLAQLAHGELIAVTLAIIMELLARLTIIAQRVLHRTQIILVLLARIANLLDCILQHSVATVQLVIIAQVALVPFHVPPEDIIPIPVVVPARAVCIVRLDTHVQEKE